MSRSLVLLCFFFKQKTAYEMRISDWSSDVCSSDLRNQIEPHRLHVGGERAFAPELAEAVAGAVEGRQIEEHAFLVADRDVGLADLVNHPLQRRIGVVRLGRSEERRVGKECVSTGRYRGWPLY